MTVKLFLALLYVAYRILLAGFTSWVSSIQLRIHLCKRMRPHQ